MTRRHRVKVTSDDIEDATIATIDIADSSVQVSKFGVQRDHGTVGSVTATGRYKTFHTAFGTPPNVVVTGINANARLAGTPTAGSFQINLDAAGTANAKYIAWGSR